MVDILQIETVTATSPPKKPPPDRSRVEVEEEPAPEAPAEIEFQPTSNNPKYPPLRRAALHFLALLIRANIVRLYNSGGSGNSVFPTHLVKRVKTTLGYVAATDEDAVVRVMANETLGSLDQMAEAMLGI